MNRLRGMRYFLAVAAAASLVECSGGAGASHAVPGAGAISSIHRRSMALGTISGCGEYPDGSVAVMDGRLGKIYFFTGPLTDSSTASATITIPGTVSGVNNVRGGMTFDANGNLWVADVVVGNAPAIYEFAAPLASGESPTLTISGSNTGLVQPFGISYNPTAGNIYVADEGASAIDVWSASASGNVAPSATISGSSTALSYPWGIKTDANYIYVDGTSNNINLYSLSASGNVSPASTISLTGEGAQWFDFDVVRNLYSPSGSEIYVWMPYNDYENYHGQDTSDSVQYGVAVDDAGYVYGLAAQTINVLDPVDWSSGSATQAVQVNLGSDVSLQSFALYSPGKFNGTEPQ